MVVLIFQYPFRSEPILAIIPFSFKEPRYLVTETRLTDNFLAIVDDEYPGSSKRRASVWRSLGSNLSDNSSDNFSDNFSDYLSVTLRMRSFVAKCHDMRHGGSFFKARPIYYNFPDSFARKRKQTIVKAKLINPIIKT